MRKIPRSGCLGLLLICLSALNAKGQWIYGASATQDSLWAIDTTSWVVARRLAPTLAAYTVTGIAGLADDPVGHRTYCLLKTAQSPNSTLLATVNLANGACTAIGDLGAAFSSIAFREDGQLMGVVGDGGGMDAERLFLIDKATATRTFAVALGNGDEGEVIGFHRDDQMLYHWSGNDTAVFEKLPATAPFSPIGNLPITGAVGIEAVGALYLGNDRFLVSSQNQELRHLTNAGQYGNVRMTTPDALSGLVMPPKFTFSDGFVCINEVATWSFEGLASDTAVYFWGDGTVSTVYPAGPATHIFSSAGARMGHACLKNSVVGLDTLLSFPFYVNPLPHVVLNPSRDTVMCVQDSLKITATFGGTSRWFRNGVQIPGAGTNVYWATLDGWYNMAKTNMNGCIDSAALGISVVFANNVPAPAITADTSACPTVLFESNDPFGDVWSWDFGDGIIGTGSNPSHTYAAVGTYNVSVSASNECHSAVASTTVVVDCFIGTPEGALDFVHVSPNPSHGHFQLQASLAKPGMVHYEVSDLTGRILLHKALGHLRGNWLENIALEGGKGLYFLRVCVGTQCAVYRLVVD